MSRTADADARCEVGGHQAGQMRNCSLGGSVRERSAGCLPADHGSDVHDATTAVSEHVRHRESAELKCYRGIEVEGCLELCDPRFREEMGN